MRFLSVMTIATVSTLLEVMTVDAVMDLMLMIMAIA